MHRAAPARGVGDALQGAFQCLKPSQRILLSAHKIQADYLDMGLKVLWPALFLCTFSGVPLNHPIDL